MLDAVERLSPADVILGIEENEDGNVDCSDGGKLLPNPEERLPRPLCWAWWCPECDINPPVRELPPVMYGCIWVCMLGFMLAPNPRPLSNGLKKSFIPPIPFLFFLLFVDIFLFLVWIPSFFIVSGRFTCKKNIFMKSKVYKRRSFYDRLVASVRALSP